MSTNRINQLLTFLKDDPQDSFALYALALEYVNINPDEAKRHFDQLLRDHADYLPTYYHAAQLYRDLDHIERAEEIYEKGIELARAQNDQKALGELNNALQNLLFEDD